MADLIANHVDSAVQRMEGEFVSAVGPVEARAQITKLFEYCGRPIDYEYKHDEAGVRLYLDGRRKPMRKFYYAGATTQVKKGECFFAVEVVASKEGLTVVSFGPLKLQSGQLPPWLR
jgi:hypothetical protein